MMTEENKRSSEQRIPFWLVPRVVRETRSPQIVRAWIQHENEFCQRHLATSFLVIGLFILAFIPLDMHRGEVNPSLSYALLLRGIPAVLLILGALAIRYGKKIMGEQGFHFAKAYGIALVGIMSALQYCYTSDFPDRASFYPPLIAAFAVFILRMDWFETLMIFGMQIWIWLLFSEWIPSLIYPELNYQLFGCLLALLFQRRVAYEAARFVSDEKRQMVERENELLQVKRTSMLLHRFLPEDVAQDIVQGRLDLSARPHKVLVTMLFCDIVNFTKLTERVPIDRLGEFLNRYFGSMTNVVFSHGGMIDKFIGDGVLGVFGFPRSWTPAEQAQKAAQCAREMLALMPNVQQDMRANFGEINVQIRIGIHQGEVIMGGFGGDARTDFMALGVTSLMAQRLKATAPEGGILVSESVAESLSYAGCEDFGERILRGIGPRRVFNLLADPDDSVPAINSVQIRDKMAA